MNKWWDEEPEKIYCKHCENYVVPAVEDVGIGPYEYWGQKGFDTQLIYLCPICEGEF